MMWFLLFFPAAWLVGAIGKAPRGQNIVMGLVSLGAVAWLGYDVARNRPSASRKTEFMIEAAMMQEMEHMIRSGQTNRILSAMPAYFETARTGGTLRAANELLKTLQAGRGEFSGPRQGAIGQRVTLVGIAEPRKLGAAVRGEDFEVWIDGLTDWAEEFAGKQVEVVGVLEERYDLPVFVADTSEERSERAGIPVPSGTDLKEASRRWVLRDAKWKLK